MKIATGYWDIPGLALLTDDIKSFLEKEGTKLFLLIGKDPYVYASQVKNPKYKDKNYLRHADLTSGGMIDYTMSGKPNQTRGTQKEARPYSMSD